MLRWLPENISTFGGQIDQLFYWIYYLTTFVFLGVFITLVVFLVKYRRREGHTATYYHGNNTLEIIWTIIPALIVVALGIHSAGVWKAIKTDIPPSDYVVKVIGKQYNWDFTYPGADGILGTKDDFTLPNELYVPANKPIRIELTATDVIHSFFVPVLRVKQDAMPGKTVPLWFEATKTGKYEIACAELCGFGHYNMRAFLTILSETEYRSWWQKQLAEQSAS